jgi:hypothetical protein
LLISFSFVSVGHAFFVSLYASDIFCLKFNILNLIMETHWISDS